MSDNCKWCRERINFIMTREGPAWVHHLGAIVSDTGVTKHRAEPLDSVAPRRTADGHETA